MGAHQQLLLLLLLLTALATTAAEIATSSPTSAIRGLLDVTLPPFSADSTGKTDATDALQR